MINILVAVNALTEIHQKISAKYPKITRELLELLNLISISRKEVNKQERIRILLEAEVVNQKIGSLLAQHSIPELEQLKEISAQLDVYFKSKYQTHLKVKNILARISMKEILLVALRAHNDYGSQPDLGLGREPYFPPKKTKIKLKPLKKLEKGEFGQTRGSLDDRQVLDGRGIAVSLRHQIEKYDPKHRPWRNFLYREYNETFDFWKKQIKNVELHLIYPDKQGDLKTILKKWIEKETTYKRDLLLIYHANEKCWKCHIRDENLPEGFATIILDKNSSLMMELKKVNAKNCRLYDKSKLEKIILSNQPFINKTKKGSVEGYYFSHDYANFYQWVENNATLKTTNGVIYLNDLQSSAYLVRVNENNELVYLTNNQPITTKLDESQRRPDETIFAMDLMGNLYIAKEGVFDPKQPELRIQHPSFKKGERLIAAGTIKVKNGKVVYINNGSGHCIPGEFSLLKVVLELQKAGVLDPSCVVEFMTMDKEDVRYKKQTDDHIEDCLPVDEFIKRAKSSFLAVIHEETLQKYSEKLSQKNKHECNTDELFTAIWNDTELSKINFCKQGNYTANVDHFLDEINNFIIALGENTSDQTGSPQTPSDYHFIRNSWKDFLFTLISDNEYITDESFIKASNNFLAKHASSLAHKNFNELFKKIINEMTIAKTMHVDSVISTKRIQSDYSGYKAQLKFASSKLLTPEDDPNSEQASRNIANYKLFSFLSPTTSLVPVDKMIKLEERNLAGLKDIGTASIFDENTYLTKFTKKS